MKSIKPANILTPYEKIALFDKALKTSSDTVEANDKKELGLGCRYEHSFTDGLYVRKMFIPKDLVIVTAIHKTQHPYFIMRGDVTVYLDGESTRIKAPFQGVTEPGTQRALRTHEDTLWITVHTTEKTDVEEIVKDIVVDNHEQYQLWCQEQKLLDKEA